MVVSQPVIRFQDPVYTTAEGKIQWIGDDLLYHRIRFSMDQFRVMIFGLVGEARAELFEKLMVAGRSSDGKMEGKQVLLIHWEKMVDEPSETKVKREAVAAYQRYIERFQELLLVLMHLCGGQPARAPSCQECGAKIRRTGERRRG